jgi:hypothetical protein
MESWERAGGVRERGDDPMDRWHDASDPSLEERAIERVACTAMGSRRMWMLPARTNGATRAKKARSPRARASLPALAGWLVAMGGALGALASGCPDNVCLLKVCDGRGNCSCSLSTCSDGAGFDTKLNRCRCLRGYFDVAGQCLDQAHANQYCGRGFAWQQTGCVKLSCKPGDSLDLATGLCVPKEQVAAQAGVQVGQGQKVGCPAGQTLVVDSGVAACVPSDQACAKDEVWNGKACQKTVNCGTGASWDPVRQQCVAYSQSGGDTVNVDVATWAMSNYGPNGGTGTPAFCSTFATKPWSFGVSEGQSAYIRVAITMSFPGSAISKGQVTTQAVYDFNGGPVPQKGADAVQAGAQSSFGALVAGGGKASVESMVTTVKCLVVNAAKPQAVPESGGF